MRAAGRRAVTTLAMGTDPASGDNGALNGAKPNELVLLHFNDVYNVESRPAPEPVGGASRFTTAIKSFSKLNPLVLFSGDIFSPSMCEYHNSAIHIET